MRKLLGLSLLVMLAISTVSWSMGPPAKVKICHICPRGTVEGANGVVTFFGWVEEIFEPALGGHLRHGDAQLESGEVGACCAFRVLPDGTILPGAD